MNDLESLRAVLNGAIDVLQQQLELDGLPPYKFDPVPHPLDTVDRAPSHKLFEARRIVMASADAISALVRPAYDYQESFSGARIAAWQVASEHKIGDLLKGSANGMHSDEIGRRLGLDGALVSRMLRVLTADCIFTEVRPDCFANNRRSFIFCGDSVMKDALTLTTQWWSPAAMFIPRFLKQPNGLLPLQLMVGDDRPFWQWLASNADKQATFGRGMKGAGAIGQVGVMNDFDWARLGACRLVDVGGGQGSLSLPLLDMHHELSLTLQDLPEVIDLARAHLSNFPNLDPARVEFQEHNFFEPNPVQEENCVYLLRYIIHDWPDQEAAHILANIAASMHATSRVLIIDSILPDVGIETAQNPLADLHALADEGRYDRLALPSPLNAAAARIETYLDATMMAHLPRGAKERTLAEVANIVKNANASLEIKAVHYTRSALHLIEVVRR